MKLVKIFALSVLTLSSINVFAGTLTHNISVDVKNEVSCSVLSTSDTSVSFNLLNAEISKDISFGIACNSKNLDPAIKANDVTWTTPDSLTAALVAKAEATDGTLQNFRVGSSGNFYLDYDAADTSFPSGMTAIYKLNSPKIALFNGTDPTKAIPNTAGTYAAQMMTLTVTF